MMIELSFVFLAFFVEFFSCVRYFTFSDINFACRNNNR